MSKDEIYSFCAPLVFIIIIIFKNTTNIQGPYKSNDNIFCHAFDAEPDNRNCRETLWADLRLQNNSLFLCLRSSVCFKDQRSTLCKPLKPSHRWNTNTVCEFCHGQQKQRYAIKFFVKLKKLVWHRGHVEASLWCWKFLTIPSVQVAFQAGRDTVIDKQCEAVYSTSAYTINAASYVEMLEQTRERIIKSDGRSLAAGSSPWKRECSHSFLGEAVSRSKIYRRSSPIAVQSWHGPLWLLSVPKCLEGP